MRTGIRKEDKSLWERRVPFVPEDAAILREQGLDIVVQASDRRAFSDMEYTEAGVPVQENLKNCDLIFGIKEISKDAIDPDRIYALFAHVIKGQPHNMPMLKRMMAMNTTLFDYERIVDSQNRRLIFFGYHAGLAGMVNALWALGKRLEVDGMETPFSRIRQMRTYKTLDEAKAAIREAGETIRTSGLPRTIHPLVIGVAGYGNVSRGVQEILDLLPIREIRPQDVASVATDLNAPHDTLYKVIFRSGDCVRPISPDARFDRQDYYRFGREKYESCFDDYVPYLDLLVNCVYWDSRYPRLVTMDICRKLWGGGKYPALRVIADISCDIEGAIQCTVRSTDPGKPVYVYRPDTGETIDGFEGHGPVILAEDMLPAELPRESSDHFSKILKKFIPAIISADYMVPFEALNLPPELKRAVILYKGQLTPDYKYIEQYLI